MRLSQQPKKCYDVSTTSTNPASLDTIYLFHSPTRNQKTSHFYYTLHVSSLTEDQPTAQEVMGNLISEEAGEPLYNLKTHVKLKQHFLNNLILIDMRSNCHIGLAAAPSRIAIRLLDDDRAAQPPLVLAQTEKPKRNINKKSDKAIVQQIANLSFRMSVVCQANLQLSSLFLPCKFWNENAKQSLHIYSKG
ncbi:hypothetical protein AVEN_56623-1 [Araneus ventricosus]|uniref:Uncharacterized protein n=1 Tax=Araneus ventricosus TaxID=182803 RepID=A0A4Y2RFJ1_ARAVE|nr:hypothetical protein AVEN_56623-1 [Araneus ventricosus]